MIINKIYEHQNLLFCLLPGRAKDLSAPLYRRNLKMTDFAVILIDYDAE